MSGVLERVETLEKVNEELKGKVKVLENAIQALATGSRSLYQKILSVEQALTAMGKTMAAISAELMDNKAIDNDSVMNRIRKIEDDEQRGQVKSMVDSGTIKAEECVTDNSLVVTQQVIVNTATGKSEVLSEYSFYSVNSPMIDEESRKRLIGKKVGDTYEGLSSGDKKEIVTIKEIYGIVEISVPGEGASAKTVNQDDAAKAVSEGSEKAESRE